MLADYVLASTCQNLCYRYGDFNEHPWTPDLLIMPQICKLCWFSGPDFHQGHTGGICRDVLDPRGTDSVWGPRPQDRTDQVCLHPLPGGQRHYGWMGLVSHLQKGMIWILFHFFLYIVERAIWFKICNKVKLINGFSKLHVFAKWKM